MHSIFAPKTARFDSHSITCEGIEYRVSESKNKYRRTRYLL